MTRKTTKPSEVKVSVSARRGRRTTTITQDITRMRLPTSLSFEGLRVTVDEEKKNPTKKTPVDPDRIKTNPTKNKRKVDITLPDATTAAVPYWKQYGVFPIPMAVRKFFPKYKELFVLKAPNGDFVVNIARAHNWETDPYRGSYCSTGSKKFVGAHPRLKPGSVVTFTKAGREVVDGKSLPCYKVTMKY